MSRQEIPRFNPQVNSVGTVPIIKPDFSPAFESAQQLWNKAANVGDGIANATAKLATAMNRAQATERDAYLADLETADILQTNRIYNENAMAGNDPELLSEKLKGYMDGRLENLPDNIRPFYQKSFEKRAAVMAVKSQDEFFRQTEINAKKSMSASLDLLKEDIFLNPLPKTEIERQSYQDKLVKFNANLQSQIDHNFITAEEADLTKRDLKKDLVVATYKSSMQGLSDDARAKAILKLQNSNIEGLNINEKQEVIGRLSAFDGQMRSVREQAFAKEKAEQELAKARKAAELEIKVSRGEADYEEVVRMEQNRIISPDQKASLFRALDVKNKEKMEQMAQLEKVAGALQGTAYLDPKDAQDKKAIDFTYQNAVKQQMAGLEPEAQKSMLLNYIEKVGVVPTSVQATLRGVFRGANPNDKVFYADLIGRIQETKPQALDDIEDKDIAQAVMINELVKSGTPNLEAVARVEDMQKSLNPARISLLKEELKEARGTQTLADKLDRAKKTFSDSFFSFSPTLPSDPQLGYNQALINDYERTYDSWFIYTNGDAKIAEEQTKKALGRLWGETTINGRSRLVKYPIEKAYPNIDPAELRNKLVSEVKSIPKYKDIDESEIILQDTIETARLWNTGQPTYRVVVKNKDGVFESVMDGDMDAWTPGKAGELQKEIALRKRNEAVSFAGGMTDKPVSLESTLQLMQKFPEGYVPQSEMEFPVSKTLALFESKNADTSKARQGTLEGKQFIQAISEFEQEQTAGFVNNKFNFISQYLNADSKIKEIFQNEYELFKRGELSAESLAGAIDAKAKNLGVNDKGLKEDFVNGYVQEQKTMVAKLKNEFKNIKNKDSSKAKKVAKLINSLDDGREDTSKLMLSEVLSSKKLMESMTNFDLKVKKTLKEIANEIQ